MKNTFVLLLELEAMAKNAREKIFNGRRAQDGLSKMLVRLTSKRTSKSTKNDEFVKIEDHEAVSRRTI